MNQPGQQTMIAIPCSANVKHGAGRCRRRIAAGTAPLRSTPFIDLMTSKGIVVEIGNYDPALTSNVGTGSGTHR